MYLNYAIYHCSCHRTEKLLGLLYKDESLNVVSIENNKEHMCARAEQNWNVAAGGVYSWHLSLNGWSVVCRILEKLCNSFMLLEVDHSRNVTSWFLALGFTMRKWRISPSRVRRSFYTPLCISLASGRLIPESAWLLRRWMHSWTYNVLCTKYFAQNLIHLRFIISAEETHTHISNRNYALVSNYSNTRLRERGTSRETAKNPSGQFFCGTGLRPRRYYQPYVLTDMVPYKLGTSSLRRRNHYINPQTNNTHSTISCRLCYHSPVHQHTSAYRQTRHTVAERWRRH